MSHLAIVASTDEEAEGSNANDVKTATRDHTPPRPAPLGCCPISAADEFSYRNPDVLGDVLVTASQRAVDAAHRGDHKDIERTLSWLVDRTADAHSYDDHASRHLIEGITRALHRAVTVAQHNRANHVQIVAAEQHSDYDHHCNDDFGDCDGCGGCGGGCDGGCDGECDGGCGEGWGRHCDDRCGNTCEDSTTLLDVRTFSNAKALLSAPHLVEFASAAHAPSSGQWLRLHAAMPIAAAHPVNAPQIHRPRNQP